MSKSFAKRGSINGGAPPLQPIAPPDTANIPVALHPLLMTEGSITTWKSWIGWVADVYLPGPSLMSSTHERSFRVRALTEPEALLKARARVETNRTGTFDEREYPL